MSDVKHTALPFEIHQGEKRIEVLDKEGLPVAHIYARGIANGAPYNQNASANARYIVQSANAYPALVEALTQLARISEVINSIQHAHNPLSPSLWAELDVQTQRARAALAQAQGDE